MSNKPQGRNIVGEENELGLSVSKGLESLLVSQDVLSGLHDHRKTRIDVLGILFDLKAAEVDLVPKMPAPIRQNQS